MARLAISPRTLDRSFFKDKIKTFGEKFEYKSSDFNFIYHTLPFVEGGIPQGSSLAADGSESILLTYDLGLLDGEIVTSADLKSVAVELFLANVYARNSHIRAIYLGTRDGSMHEWGVGPGFIDNTPVFPEGYDPRLRPWYKEAVEADGFALTEPYTYASVEAMGITAVRPVYADGEFIGVLGLDLIFDGLQNLVNSLHIEKGGRVMLLSKNLQILVDQFKPSYDLITEIQTFDQPQLLTADNTQREVIMDGQRYLLEHTVNEATGWTLLMFIPYEEIMAYSQQNLMIIIFLDLILMLLLGVLVTLYSRTILTTPLESIIQVLQRRE